MIRLTHPAAKEHFATHRREVVGGVRLLLEAFAIEVTEEIAEAIPGRVLDGTARRRVRRVLAGRVDDFVAYLERLDQ
jgi:hypothetical protein